VQSTAPGPLYHGSYLSGIGATGVHRQVLSGLLTMRHMRDPRRGSIRASPRRFP
jgi:hypothetical protein